MFKTGDKVICIDDRPHPKDVVRVIKDQIYTIEKPIGDEVLIKEIPRGSGDRLILWFAFRFKPVQPKYESLTTKLANIKIITETSDQPMKNPNPVPEPMKELVNNLKL